MDDFKKDKKNKTIPSCKWVTEQIFSCGIIFINSQME